MISMAKTIAYALMTSAPSIRRVRVGIEKLDYHPT
jgi:hypothetical protein